MIQLEKRKDFFKNITCNYCIILCTVLAVLHFVSGFSFLVELLMSFVAIIAFAFLPMQKSFNLFLFMHCFTMSNLLYESTLIYTLFGFTIMMIIRYIVGLLKKDYMVHKKLLLTILLIFVISLCICGFYSTNSALLPYLTYFPLIYLFFAMRKEFNIHESMNYMLLGLIYSCAISLISLAIPEYNFYPISPSGRFLAFMNNENYLSMRAIFVLSYYIYRFLKEELKAWKFLSIFCFLSVVTFATQSKTGFSLWVILLLMLIVFYLKKDFKNRIKNVSIFLGVIVLVSLISYRQLAALFSRFFDTEDFWGALLTGRDDIWSDYLKETFSSPVKALFGQGLISNEVFIHAEGVMRASHNLYLFILYRFGIIGTLAIGYLICLFIVETGKEKPKAVNYIPLVGFLFQSFCDNTFKSFNFTYIILVAMILFDDCKPIEQTLKTGEVIRKRTVYEFCIKRIFDFTISLIAIIVLSPVFLIIGIINAIVLKGNPILKQYRPGKCGRIFTLYKFKSMKDTIGDNGELLPDNERITKFGVFIRRIGIDELPQLFNILKGDMSIVGPRPRLVKDMIFYSKETFEAYCVRPGFTGPAQVYDRGSKSSWEEVFERDKQYAKNITFLNDLKLLVGTFFSVFTKARNRSKLNENEPVREYYYPDQLLKDNKITKEQYDQGLKLAKSLKPNEVVKYLPNLRESQNVENKGC